MQRPTVIFVDGVASAPVPELVGAIDADVAVASTVDDAIALARGKPISAGVLRSSGSSQDLAAVSRAFLAKAGHETPFAVIAPSVAHAQAAFAQGAADFWREPVDPAQLAVGVRSLLFRETRSQKGRTGARTVLVADDDLFFLRRVSDLLESAGHKTLQARSGTEALALLESAPERPALCVMDLFMPGIGGIELMQRVRDNPKWANMPIIAVSGVRRDRSVLDELSRLGVRDFVDKAAVAIDSVAAIADEYLSDPTLRRRAPRRVSTFALADFRRAPNEPWLTGLVCNISTSGAFIRTLMPPDGGNLVHLRVELGSGGAKLMTRARVAWTRTRQAGSAEPHGMGVEFTELSDEATRALDQWVTVGSALPVSISA